MSPGGGGEWSRRLPYRRRTRDVTSGAMRRSAQVIRTASSAPRVCLSTPLIRISCSAPQLTLLCASSELLVWDSVRFVNLLSSFTNLS